MTPLYVVTRRTTDWDDEAAVRAQLPQNFEWLVDLWNATFTMPYFQFRAALKRITLDSHARIKGAVMANLEDVPEGGLIAPCDDDDWYAPHLAAVLRDTLEPGRIGCRWKSRWIEVPPDFPQWLGAWRRRILKTPQIWSCTTNNYAFVKCAATEGLEKDHIRATRWFDSHPDQIKVLGDSLSVANRNLASQTSLRFAGSSAAPMTAARLRFRHWRYRTIYARRPSKGLEWAAPYIAAMANLMGELRFRR